MEHRSAGRLPSYCHHEPFTPALNPKPYTHISGSEAQVLPTRRALRKPMTAKDMCGACWGGAHGLGDLSSGHNNVRFAGGIYLYVYLFIYVSICLSDPSTYLFVFLCVSLSVN